MILGIDYGRAHLGLATSEGSLARPEETVANIADVTKRVQDWHITKIVLGISEGKMAEETRAWGKKLSDMVQLPVEYIDETLSSVEVGESRKKSKDHAKAAAVILQRYLDDREKK